MKRPHSHESQRGFTIIELLIAMAVLSTILVLATVMITNIGRLYYKGINQARIQGGVRNTIDEVSQQLQLSGTQPLTASQTIGGMPINAYCIGTTRYTYIVGVQVGTGNDIAGVARIPHALWRDIIGSPQSCSVANLTASNPSTGTGGSNGAELVPPSSRLTAFCIGALSGSGCSINTTSPYTLSVGMAYGDSDLLNQAGINTHCKGAESDQFCSTAALTTTVTRRL